MNADFRWKVIEIDLAEPLPRVEIESAYSGARVIYRVHGRLAEEVTQLRDATDGAISSSNAEANATAIATRKTRIGAARMRSSDDKPREERNPAQ